MSSRRWCLRSAARRRGDPECGHPMQCCVQCESVEFRSSFDLVVFRSKLVSGTSWLSSADVVSRWVRLFWSSRPTRRCLTDVRRSSDVEVPTEWVDPYSWRKMLAFSLLENVRCRSWTFIDVRIRGLSGSSGLSVPGLLVGIRILFDPVRVRVCDTVRVFDTVRVCVRNWSRLQTMSSYSSLIQSHGAGRPQTPSKTTTPANLTTRHWGPTTWQGTISTNMHPTVLKQINLTTIYILLTFL